MAWHLKISVYNTETEVPFYCVYINTVQKEVQTNVYSSSKFPEYGGLNWQGYEGLEIYITRTIQKFRNNIDRKISRE
jgi:hypothetical protein